MAVSTNGIKSVATMPGPKIIVATLARPSGTTGLQSHFNTFLAYLRSQGVRTELVTPFSFPGLLPRLVFAVRRIAGRINPSISVWWYETWHAYFLKLALQRALGTSGAGVVYAQCPLSARAALQARRSTTQRIVLVVHFNGSQADEWAVQAGLPREGRIYGDIKQRERDIIPAVDGIVYVSEFVKGRITGAVPEADRVPSAVIPNFVSPPEPEVTSVRNDLISIGTLEERKNQAYLLRVLAEAKLLGKRYGLTLIGDGADRPRLEALANDLGLRDQVRFLGFQAEARRFLTGHRVYVHSAHMESFGIVLAEAMAAGLPVCAAPNGGIAETFDNGVEGFYWDLDDPADGALRLMRLLEDNDLYARMAAAARARFESDYQTEKVAERLYRFLVEDQPTVMPAAGAFSGGPL